MKEVVSERCFRKEEGGRGRGSSSGEGVYPVTLYELVLRYCVQYCTPNAARKYSTTINEYKY